VLNTHAGFAKSLGALCALALLSVAALTGCSSASVPTPVSTTPEPSALVLSDEEDSFGGRLLQVVVEGLATGAAQQAGGDAYGNILAELGWGTPSDSQRYDAMMSTLADIEDGLTEIGAELAQLQAQLKITEDEIIANSNDPTEAIDKIDTYNRELQALGTDGHPGTGDRSAIINFAHQVEGAYAVEGYADEIGDAIIPLTVAKRRVLDNYASLLIAKMDAGEVDLRHAYFALENYFAQLMYYQLQGVTLVVEAKTALVKSGESPDGATAAEYYATFISKKLGPEVQSFMDNAWRLVVARVSLKNTSGFLPADAQGIAARAEFLRTQTLGLDHFGLRADAVVTKNHRDTITEAVATATDGTSYTAKATSTTVTGPVYDSWTSYRVESSADYQVVSFDFGAVPAGRYTLTGGAAVWPASILVQHYTADYTPDSAGKIVYGAGMAHTRLGAQEAFAAGAGVAHGRTWEHGGAAQVSFSGNLEAGKITASGGRTNGGFSGEYQVDYRFAYTGAHAVTVEIPTTAYATGTVKTTIDMNLDDPGSASAQVAATMGVWDSTTGATVSAKNTWTKAVENTQSASPRWKSPGKFSFTAKPGHAYTCLLYTSPSPRDRTRSRMPSSA
jgi:hypothetical protein